MIDIIYRCNGEEFKEDELIQVIRRDVFTEERSEITGRVVKSLLNSELVLDVSTRYNAKTITINMDEIVKINKIKYENIFKLINQINFIKYINCTLSWSK